jgi:hypothetical protein
MPRPGEDKGYADPLIPFVMAIIMWMWAGVIYLSGDREIPLFGKALTDFLKWVFGHIVAAVFFVLLGMVFVRFGIWQWRNKKKSSIDENEGL